MSEITQKDWDELKEKYEKLRLNEEMYRVAIGMTDHTISVVDIPNRTLNQIHNEGDWTGVSVSMPDVPESVLATGIIHPDDHQGYRDFYDRIYSGVPDNQFTMRVKEENRGWVWFTMYARTVFDEAGNPLRAICFSDDITVEKKAQEKFEQYRNAVTADADFIWEADLTNDQMLLEDENFGTVFSDREYVKYSDICKTAFEAIEDPIQKNTVMETFGREALIKAFENAKREVSLEYQFDYQDGRGLRWIHSTAYLMTNNVEDIVTIICTNDVTERHNEQEALERKAERDSLTGLFNRYSFESRVSAVLADSEERSHGFLMVDVDNFKHFNDTYGHAFGDSVLQMIANVMHSAFRMSDIIGRVGGDEFMVFMLDAGNADLVRTRAENLQKDLADTCAGRGFPARVTLSIGAALSRKGEDFQSLYLRADEALYKSKDRGKNTVSLV